MIHGLDLIPTLTYRERAAIIRIANAYREQYHIYFKVLDVSEKGVVLRITQQLPGSKVLSNKELAELGKATFREIDRIEVRARPLVFKGIGRATVDRHWIHRALKRTGISERDLVEALNLDSDHLRRLLNGKTVISEAEQRRFFSFFVSDDSG